MFILLDFFFLRDWWLLVLLNDWGFVYVIFFLLKTQTCGNWENGIRECVEPKSWQKLKLKVPHFKLHTLDCTISERQCFIMVWKFLLSRAALLSLQNNKPHLPCCHYSLERHSDILALLCVAFLRGKNSSNKGYVPYKSEHRSRFFTKKFVEKSSLDLYTGHWHNNGCHLTTREPIGPIQTGKAPSPPTSIRRMGFFFASLWASVWVLFSSCSR